MIRATFLGTGTSQGVPVIGCQCKVCLSDDHHDHRLRSSLFVRYHDLDIVIDAGPDFRQQMLRAGQQHLDAILLTHEHNDHVAGLDDVRPFNFRQQRDMPIYAEAHVLGEITSRFAYAFDDHPYPGAPRFDRIRIQPEHPFQVSTQFIQPIRVWHGSMPVIGFRMGELTYVTDAKTIPEEEVDKIRGTRVLILNALRQEPHSTHLHLEAAIALAKEVGAERTYFTHISHSLGMHHEVSGSLPDGCLLAYDDLTINV